MMARQLSLLPVALLVLAACGHKPEGGGAPGASASAARAPVAASAKAPTAPTTTTLPATSGSAAPTAAPSGSADADADGPEPATGRVHIHLQSVKVTGGKNDGAEKLLKGHMLKLRTTCVNPALKKTPTFEGTLKVTLEAGADGKLTKATAKASTGKLPEDLLQCTEKFYLEKLQVDPSKATIETTILVGPKANADH
jgi:hypothetical protein